MHPTASLIARQATAQDDITGDGTTSSVMFTGELMSEAERICTKGLHPRVLVEGYERAREEALKHLDEFKTNVDNFDEEVLLKIARTSLRTKVSEDLADHLANIVVKAVLTVRDSENSNEIDLHMIEIMHMRHGAATDTRFVDGLVLDHGARHPNMAKRSEKVAIFVCNVSLEYEKTMDNSTMMYKSAEERRKLVLAERRFTDDKVKQIIAFKEATVGTDGSFVVINQGGIDPISLDLLQKAGIVGIRRAKRRNMERLSKACGGYAVSALDDLTPDCLGHADLVYEHTLGDDVFTFVEGCKASKSCTVLINGPNDHTIAQIKGALRDGLRATANAILDKSVVLGAGAFELSCYHHLMKYIATSDIAGRLKIGVRAFADALLVIPKTLAQNAGFDAQTTTVELLDETRKGTKAGVDLETGKAVLPEQAGIYDNYCVKRQFIHLGTMMATNLLLVDEVMRAGKKMNGKE
jgi:T-complex protein 1 subunit zeta